MHKNDLEALEYEFFERMAICMQEGKLDAVRAFSVAWGQVQKHMQGMTKEERHKFYYKWKEESGERNN